MKNESFNCIFCHHYENFDNAKKPDVKIQMIHILKSFLYTPTPSYDYIIHPIPRNRRYCPTSKYWILIQGHHFITEISADTSCQFNCRTKTVHSADYPTGAVGSRARAKPDGTRAETTFRLSPKRTRPFKSAGGSVQSTAGSRGVRISVSNAGYTMFRGRVRVLATRSIRQFPLHFPSRASPCATTFRTQYNKRQLRDKIRSLHNSQQQGQELLSSTYVNHRVPYHVIY
jgi:hypothetical protein